MFSLITRGDLQPTPPVSITSPPRQTHESFLNPPEMEHIEECVQEGDAHGSLDIQMVCISVLLQQTLLNGLL